MAKKGQVFTKTNNGAKWSKGASSWDDLDGKPFGETKTVIEWDGVIGDRTNIVLNETSDSKVTLVRMGDAIPVDTLIGSKFAANDGTIIEEVPAEYVTVTEAYVMALDGFVFVRYKSGYVTINNNQYYFDEPGTYFMLNEVGDTTMYAARLEYTTVEQIDPKFLPDILNTVEFRSTSKYYNFYENADENKSVAAQKLVNAIQNGSRAVVIYSGSDAYIKTEYFKTMDEQTNNNDAYLFVGWKVVDDASPEVVTMKLYYDASVSKYVVANT